MHTQSSAKRKRVPPAPPSTSTSTALTKEAVKSLPRRRTNPVYSWLDIETDTMPPRNAPNLDPSTSQTKPSRSARTSVPSIYDPQVPIILFNAGIHTPRDSNYPSDMAKIRERLHRRRRSCSPSQFPNLEAMFEEVEAAVNDADNEEQYKQEVVMQHFCQGTKAGEKGYNTSFSVLNPMTQPSDSSIPAPKPDYFLGEHYGSLPLSILKTLEGEIVPTIHSNPVLINQTLEIKGPGGKFNTGIVQATHSTAASTRAMNALDLYCNPNAPVHGIGRSCSLIFTDGFMQVFVGYSEKPLDPGGPTRYYTVRCGGECFVGSPQQLLNAKRLWHNAAEWTQELRKDAVKRAIARHEQSQNTGSLIPQKRANPAVNEDEEDKQDDDGKNDKNNDDEEDKQDDEQDDDGKNDKNNNDDEE